MSVVTKDTIQPASGQALTIKDEGGTASITVATNGEATFAENIKITANKGINFSAYATSGNPSSNLLDDYEEGTFTPAFTSSGATFTTDSANGYYTKIGDMVHFTLWIKTTGVSGTTSNGLYVTGLPFTASNYTNYFGSTTFIYMVNLDTSVGAGGFMSTRLDGNTSQLSVFRTQDDSTTVQLLASSADSSDCRLIVGGTYKTG